MNILILILTVSAACLGLFSLFMLLRNEWVYHHRIRILHADMDKYYRLHDYDEMMRRWWIWDVEKFIRK